MAWLGVLKNAVSPSVITPPLHIRPPSSQWTGDILRNLPGGDKSKIWDAPYVMIGLGSVSTVGDTDANLLRLPHRVEPEDQPLYDLRHHYSQQPAEAVEATLRSRPNQRVDQ